MVNTNVNGNTKTVNHRKMLRKRKNSNLLKTNRKLNRAQFLHLACQGGEIRPFVTRSVTSLFPQRHRKISSGPKENIFFTNPRRCT